MVQAILEQAYGYCYILALGAVFAALMIGITKALEKYAGEVQDSEHFTTASRNVKTGLVASAYGIPGAWYAFAFTIQITFFSVVALEIKRKAPGAHTVLEIVRARFGRAAHWVCLFYGMGTNVIISAMLLLGGCQAISVITGMHVVAAAMLLPLGVWAYTVTGGLKSTFLSDWIHTVIIYVVIAVALFTTYTQSSKIGSIDKMYELLQETAKTNPSAGYKGSYLTWTNKTALFNGWNIVVGGFSTVFTDPSYSQKALAASPRSSMWGYFFGGLCWLIIPLALSSCTALSALALMHDKSSPTYPGPIPAELVNEGIPMLYGMYQILGRSGAAAGMLMVWLAATSATSAELIGFSSVVTYDIYRAYINPAASGKQLIRVSHLCVTVFAIAMGALTVVFNYIGITISWIITFIGIALGPGVFAFVLTLFWKKMTPLSVIIGPPLATVIAIIGWCSSAKSLYGAVNKDTLGEQYSCAVGNFVGLFSSLIFIVAISYIRPLKEDYDFGTLDSNFVAGDDATVQEAKAMEVAEKDSAKELKRYSTIAQIMSWAFFFIVIFLIPMPMYGQKYIYSKKFFRAWIVIIMIWLLLAACFIIFYPLWESRDVAVKIFRVVTGRQPPERPLLLSAQTSRRSDEEVDHVTIGHVGKFQADKVI
ncbi:hypothetical protein KL936_004688 [Ogataea polymorpha]|nr:hypothetical protein KL936_004688 [Ogataea polymorpha]